MSRAAIVLFNLRPFGGYRPAAYGVGIMAIGGILLATWSGLIGLGLIAGGAAAFLFSRDRDGASGFEQCLAVSRARSSRLQALSQTPIAIAAAATSITVLFVAVGWAATHGDRLPQRTEVAETHRVQPEAMPSAEVPPNPDTPSEQAQVGGRASIEILGVRVAPFRSATGLSMAMIYVDWKNTGGARCGSLTRRSSRLMSQEAQSM